MRSSIRPSYLLLRFLVVLAILAWLAPPASAESLQGHVLAGRSVQARAAAPRAAGEPVRTDLVLGPEFGIGGVRVSLVDGSDPKAVFATRTAADGHFAIDGLPAGTYRVVFEHGVLGQRTVQAMIGKGAGELVFVWETVPGRPPGDLPPPAARP